MKRVRILIKSNNEKRDENLDIKLENLQCRGGWGVEEIQGRDMCKVLNHISNGTAGDKAENGNQMPNHESLVPC